MRRTRSIVAFVIAALGLACATPAPERDEAAAGNDVVADTTPTEPIPADPAPADGGGGTEGGGTDGVGVTPPITTPPAPRPSVDPIQVTIFNRFLIKPVDKAMPETEIRRVVEETVGAPVVTLRRTAVGYWLVQLAPAQPPRGAPEQQAVIATLQKTGAFAVVEGDQLMTIK